MTFQINLPPRADWPRIKRPSLLWLIAIATFEVACIPIVFVHFDNLSLLTRSLLIGGSLILPIVIWVAMIAVQRARVVWQRNIHYDLLQDYIKQIASDLEEEQDRIHRLMQLVETITPLRKYKIIDARKKEGETLLEIEDKQSLLRRLHVDNEIFVINPKSSILLGRFVVTQVLTDGYLARAVDIRDGLWWTSVCKQADESMRLQTNAIAISAQQRTGEDS